MKVRPLVLVLFLTLSLSLTVTGRRARKRSADGVQKQGPHKTRKHGKDVNVDDDKNNDIDDDDGDEKRVDREGVSVGEGTPFPPPSSTGLFAVVEKLVQQVAELNERYEHDRTRIRRTERRGRHARSDIDVMHADVVQLRQHVTEIHARLDALDETTADLELDVAKVTDEQHKLKEEWVKVKQGQRTLRERVETLENNISIEGGPPPTQRNLTAVETTVSELERGQGHILTLVEKLGSKLEATKDNMYRMARKVKEHFSLPWQQAHKSKDSAHQGLRQTTIPGRTEQKGTERQPRDLSQEVRAGAADKAFVTNSNGTQSDDASTYVSDDASKNTTQFDDASKNAKQFDDAIGKDGIPRKPNSSRDRLNDELDGSGDDDGFFKSDDDVFITNDVEISNSSIVSNGSGDSDDDFFVVEDLLTTDLGSGDVGDGGGDVTTSDVFVTEDDDWFVTPTPLTTDLPTTLTQASVTWPTSPCTHSCPSLAEFTSLEERVQTLQSRLDGLVPTEEILTIFFNETERLDEQAVSRDQTLNTIQANVSDLDGTVSRLAEQLASLRLSDFMDRLHASLVSFTSNVLTLDQWNIAHQELTQASHVHEVRFEELSKRVLEEAEVTSRLQVSLREHAVMSERQYRLLQSHVIRLNNSLQDLQEHLNHVKNVQIPYNGGRVVLGSANGGNQFNEQGQSLEVEGQGQVLRSRMDDLALQLVYSDNRLSHLETQMLNASLGACKKSNNDVYQDASIQRMDQHLATAQTDIAILKETAKRLDLGLYRLHGDTKVNHDAVRKVEGQVKGMTGLEVKVGVLRKEVDNLLFQLPADCDDYYERGYRRNGDYVIYPRHAPHSIRVRCVMHTSDDVADADDVMEDYSTRDDKGRGRDGKVRRVTMEEGGWTVIQQRHNGKVNFTRSWAEYAVGFGSTDGEYWLGNEHLHLVTDSKNFSLYIAMTDIFGGHWSAAYRKFRVGDKGGNYRLDLDGYYGNATDTMTYSAGMTFSTYDKDTDLSSSPCAKYNGGGWWYSHCMISNLNGPYDIGMIWFHRDWKDWLQLRHVVMAIKPLTS